MLRAMDEKQGIGIYTQNLLDELLALDSANAYVLFYRNPSFLGRYGQHAHVTERLVTAPNKAVWDQVKIPLAARAAGVDLIFHTKFTVPFLTRRATVMTVHGASWFVHPELYGGLDIAYVRRFMPLYCRKAAAIIANSELTRTDFIRLVGVPPEKIHTVRLGTNPSFRPIPDQAELDAARAKYALPESYILAVVKYDPRKNFGNLIQGFRLLRRRTPYKLVVVGIGCEKYRAEYALDADGTAEDVRFLGWVEQPDLPALYNLATCLLFPSVYEEFGIPTCEAMACGCPVVVSTTGALPEIAGEAGLLVDPFDPESIAAALERMVTDGALREELASKCLERAKAFTWARCARETLEVLNRVR